MKTIIVGRFGKVFGLKGWIKVHSYTTPQENILSYTPWYITHPKQAVPEIIAIQEHKWQGDHLVVKLPSCDNCDAARLYTNLEIAVTRDVLPKTKPNEYYWRDLEELDVINQQNIDLGKVDYVTNSGANDILVVKDPAKNRERWIPFIPNVIKKVDVKKRLITVDWDEDF